MYHDWPYGRGRSAFETIKVNGVMVKLKPDNSARIIFILISNLSVITGLIIG